MVSCSDAIIHSVEVILIPLPSVQQEIKTLSRFDTLWVSNSKSIVFPVVLISSAKILKLTTALAIPVNFNEPSIQPLDTQFKSENVVVISP